MLVEIIKVDDMKELSELGKEEFEKNALEGPAFKSIVRSIENSAVQGYTGWHRTLDSTDDLRELHVIRKALIAAGYKCEIISETKTNLFGFDRTENTFHVDWD